MSGDIDRPSVRLAELVAALSLGVDLGFGQPMEHVLRQCLIALRLAERIGFGRRAAGRRVLHSAARQCRLSLRRPRAGEVVRRRHRAEVREVRPRARKRARCRCRVPADRVGQPAAASVSGRTRVHARGTSRRRRDGAASTLASPACSASSSTCRRTCSRRSAAPTSSGTATAGRAICRETRFRCRRGSHSWRSSPRSRIASAASRRRRSSHAARAGTQFDPGAGRARVLRRRADLRRPRRSRNLGRGDRCRAGARARPLGRRVRRRAARDRGFRRPEVAVHARSCSVRSRSSSRTPAHASTSPEPERADAATRRARPRLRPTRRFERDLGQARSARRRRVGARALPPVPDRAHAPPVGRTRAAGRDRGRAPRAARRLGVSARALRLGDLPPGPAPRCGGRLPGDARASPLSPAAQAPRKLRPSCAPTSRAAGSTPTPSRPCSARRATVCLDAAADRPGLTPREVEVLRLLARGLSNKEIAARASSSHRRRSGTTSSTSTRRSMRRRGRRPACSPMRHGLLPEDAVEVAA